MLFKGFRFGLLSQIAIGPVCIYIITTAVKSGTYVAWSGVLAATIVDVIFVTLAIIGVGSLLSKRKVRLFFKYFSTIVSVYFGIGIILSTAGINIIPSLANTDIGAATSNVFITTFILTAANPLSVLFWAGIFSSRVVKEGFTKNNMVVFGCGIIISSLTFLGQWHLYSVFVMYLFMIFI